ncbi:hypothetical protein SAMN04487948_105228 [Halogranum amylolyticum]|uniref:Uncharacterized protein n=1 Tax=Halogranum amylolyticum TaxID=660520 RepID=A0A1H8SQ13_9EURY|nr:hypothetical protein [Halogranum amylolyticum]SEO80273.1 hypothetical protein SAMN04487948_105228 [Halogranum amylolyticum]
MALELVSGVILSLFTFGTAIFYILSRIERFVLALAFDEETDTVEDDDVRFVHRVLKHLIPILPPSYGFVMLFGTLALLYQGFERGWDRTSVVIISYYWGISGYSLVFGDIVGAVNRVKNTSSDADIGSVRRGVRELVVQHHLGLAANVGVVVLEFIFIVWLSPM